MKMVHVLFAAVAAGAVAAGAQSFAGSRPSAAPSAAPLAPSMSPNAADAPAPDHEAAAAPEPAAGAGIDGEVLEILQVPSYSYLRLGERGGQGTWVAVPTTGLRVGDAAHVGDAMKMTDFTSTALGRTFPVIYFGTLAGGPPAHGMGLSADAHGQGADPHAMLAGSAAASAPHAPLGPVDVAHVERAEGPNGKTVAEVVLHRVELAGKTVRVHATVVKSTPGVLGRTYLHLRDGSGDPAAGTHDVVVTTEATPAVGDVVVVEGVVVVDRDIGAGYRFPTLVEDAKILPAP